MNNDSKINVLHLMTGFGRGGAEKLLIDIFKESKPDDNIKYKMLCLKDVVNESYEKELEALGVELIVWKAKDFRNPLTLLKLLKFVNDNSIDVIHSHSCGARDWAILCKIVKPKLKLVFTIHDVNIIPDNTSFKRFIHSKMIDGTIAISKYIYQQWQDYSMPNIYQFNNGIKLEKFIKNKAQINDDPYFINIVNVSRLSLYKKGQEILIKALGECKNRNINFKCSFIGGIFHYDPDAPEVLTKLAKEQNIEAEVALLGDRNDVPELLSKADLFILPSRYEGMPLALLEAMAAGLPVIASDIVSNKELITHEENGLLFESKNYIDLADKITELYNNREKMRAIAENGFNFVQDFDISIMVRNYHNLYKSLVNGNG